MLVSTAVSLLEEARKQISLHRDNKDVLYCVYVLALQLVCCVYVLVSTAVCLLEEARKQISLYRDNKVVLYCVYVLVL